MYRLYGSEARLAERYGFREQFRLAPTPAGLGVRAKGEMKEYFTWEFFFNKGALKIMAGALETAEKLLGRKMDAPLVRVPQRDWAVTLKLANIFGKGEVPTVNKKGLEVHHDPEKKGVAEYYTLQSLYGLGADVTPKLTTAAGVVGQIPGLSVIGTIGGIIGKISNLVTGLHDKALAETREKNAKEGLSRFKEQILPPIQSAYTALAEALASRGVSVPEKATDAYYNELVTRCKFPHTGYKRGYDVYTPWLRKFTLMMEAATPLVLGTQPITAPSAVPGVVPAGTQAPAPASTQEGKAGAAWVIPAALVALKLFA